MKHKNTLLSFRLRLQLMILLAVFISCTRIYGQDNCSQVSLTASDLKETNAKKILFLVADDRSGSTKNHAQPNRMTEQHYKDLLQVFIENGYKGQFDIRVIGNPEHTGFEPPLTFASLYQLIPIPIDATLSEKTRIRCKNKHIEEKNNAAIASNKTAISSYIANTIRTKIIGYKPAGRDITDIDHAFRDIEIKLNSSANMGYNKIYVVVMCDGNDSNKSRNLKLKTNASFELIRIGWPPNKKIIDGPETILGSVDDLVDWFKNTKI